MITVEGIRATGLYLLELLLREQAVDYSRFYNEKVETADELANGAIRHLSEKERDAHDDLREEGHVMLEFAAWQLEDLRIVRIDFLSETLIDGEPDFRIEVTEQGTASVIEQLGFSFRRPDYSIYAGPASKWLISSLESEIGGSDTVTLWSVMKSGPAAGEVAIHDDCSNVYTLGSGTYAWAFEVCLWHHARAGTILRAELSGDMPLFWENFVNQAGRPDRPCMGKPHPVWEIPLRLNDDLTLGQVAVQHVGNVS